MSYQVKELLCIPSKSDKVEVGDIAVDPFGFYEKLEFVTKNGVYSEKSFRLGDNGKLFTEYNSRVVIRYDLHVVSDEEIKINDWYVDDCNQIRESVTSDRDYWSVRKSYKKLVASTDKSLGLPKIPKECKSFYIKECKMGLKLIKINVKYNKCFSGERMNMDFYEKLDINPDNFITFKPIKKSWTKEELDKILLDVMNLGMDLRQNQLNGYSTKSGRDTLEEWKLKNLYE